jgi:hypothetical protein
VPVVPDTEVERRAREALAAAGAMFTKKSAFAPDGPSAVRVTDIVLATARGDRLVSFRYDAALDQVASLDDRGNPLPFTVPLERYLDWVKGE